MLTSAKYNMLHPPLIERIYAEESKRGSKNLDKAVKTRLHQMFGAYTQGNSHKKAIALLDEMDNDGQAIGNLRKPIVEPVFATEIFGECRKSGKYEAGFRRLPISAQVMALHASTKERLPYIKDFYNFIAHHTGNFQTILDLGCGFNPFSIPFIPTPELKSYHAYDIDTRTSNILNRFFAHLNLPQAAACADLIVDTPSEKVDLALMCKLVPVLESQAGGRGFELARQLNANFLTITYPLKSLGGREKGMGKNYAAQFEQAVESGALGDYTVIASCEIGNELIYICKK